MKNHLFFLFLFFGIGIAFQYTNAQSWAPVGAKWHFTKHHNLSSEVSYTKIEVEKDTIVQGKNCTKLVGNFDGCIWKSQIMYESNDSIYFYHTQNNEFSMLFDFGATPGDTWEIPNITTNFGLGLPDTTKLIVDSIGQILVSGQNLKIIYTSQINLSSSDFEFGGPIIQSIGASNMFPYFFACDPVAGELRCYQDSVINYKKDITIDCEYSTVDISEFELTELNIYPNPVNDIIYLNHECYDNQNTTYKLLDMSNKLVAQGFLLSKTLDVSLLKNGIYNLIILSENNKILTTIKILKL